MKVQIKGYITYDKPYEWETENHGFKLMDFDPTGMSTEYVLVREQMFDVEVPDNFDPRPQMVKELEAEKEKARADFAKRVMEIDKRINELLALEHTA